MTQNYKACSSLKINLGYSYTASIYFILDFSSFRFTAKKLKKAAYTVFPPAKWVPNYKIKKYLFDDFAAGLTVGIVHLPQGNVFNFSSAVG